MKLQHVKNIGHTYLLVMITKHISRSFIISGSMFILTSNKSWPLFIWNLYVIFHYIKAIEIIKDFFTNFQVNDQLTSNTNAKIMFESTKFNVL